MKREKYFFTIEEDVDYNKQLVLIIYDIIDNKTRIKFSKLMEGYGNRIKNLLLRLNLQKDNRISYSQIFRLFVEKKIVYVYIS